MCLSTVFCLELQTVTKTSISLESPVFVFGVVHCSVTKSCQTLWPQGQFHQLPPSMLGRKIQTLLEVPWEAKRPLLVGRVILVFLSIFTKSQASSPFEAMNSAHLSMIQKDEMPSVQKRWRIMAFARVSTGNAAIPSSCEMKYEPAFKPLQWNAAFFWVRASRGPFHLRQKTQIPSHIPISEGRLLLRCLWKAGLPLQSKTGNHSYPEMIWGARNIPHAALLKMMIL